MKMTESHKFSNKHNSVSSSFDDESGRSRLADFLYGEYSLEEVIYQLAKTMFTQSLTHGSEESQTALQKLTQFLESEGKQGRISPSLQKKVLGSKQMQDCLFISTILYNYLFFRCFACSSLGYFE
jgi:hypothetical protein